MQTLTEYDVAIVGGGLAGLAAAIQLRKMNHSVILFEKETYPFHKVCGEYVSMESVEFLNSLGVPIGNLHLPVIEKLHITAPNGKSFITDLPLGGFGISRYLLDSTLAQLAIDAGVHLMQKTKVDSVTRKQDFIIHFNGQAISAHVCCAAYGKRSNLDVKWKRSFLNSANARLDNFVGVKYHIKTDWKENVIGLHNFENGYCGISKIEDDKYCLCYMTNAENLRKHNNSVPEMEKNILFQNPHLKKIFLESEIIQDFPITISQINFNSKTKVENGVFMLGDAAGMITPLCGNGMSIALHSAKIVAGLVHQFLDKRMSRSELEKQYEKEWQTMFASRLRTGRRLQQFFGSKALSNIFVGCFKLFPFMAKPLIKLTHGKRF